MGFGQPSPKDNHSQKVFNVEICHMCFSVKLKQTLTQKSSMDKLTSILSFISSLGLAAQRQLIIKLNLLCHISSVPFLPFPMALGTWVQTGM